MSRDAKVGLVIVFAFVFLFGTILVHRLHSSPAALDGGEATARANPAGAETAGGEEQAANTAEAPVEATIVDAVAEPAGEPYAARSRRATPEPVIVTGSQVPAAESLAAAMPHELPGAAKPGGQIMLDADSSVGGAADPADAAPETNRFAPARPSAEVFSAPTRPLLDVSPRQRGEMQPSGMTMPEPATNAAHDATETDREPPTSSFDPTASNGSFRSVAPIESPDSATPVEPAEETTGEGRFSRVPASPPRSVFDSEEPDAPIRQTGGKRTPERTTPTDRVPPPPRYTAQPTIEAVEASDPRAAATRGSEPLRQPLLNEAADPARPAMTPRGVPAGERTYVVQEGDNFWKISAKAYGTSRYFQQLEQYNLDRLTKSGKDRVLRPGTVIVLPDVSSFRSSQPAGAAAPLGAAAPRTQTAAPSGSTSGTPTYVVRESDTLSAIALRTLGTSRRWEEIYQLNRKKLADPHHLIPGTELVLPSASPSERIAERPYGGR